MHIIPGIDDPTCGIAVAAKMIARQQGRENEVRTVCFKKWTREDIVWAEEVWVHSMWTPWVMKAAWCAIREGKRLVRMPHGCMDPKKIRHHFYKKVWVLAIEKALMRRAQAIVGTIPDEIEQIKALVPRYRGEIVLRSLASGFGAPREVGETKGRTTGREKLNLLYVGRLHPLKGVEFLIRAMGEKTRLVVIGKDEGEGEKLKALARELGAKVDFRGIVSEEEKNAAFEECDVFVLPTLSENFGLVVAEALERGKRVITTDGAPAWAPEALDLKGRDAGRGDKLEHGSRIAIGAGGRLLYLEGYRDGSEETRVKLLKDALARASAS